MGGLLPVLIFAQTQTTLVPPSARIAELVTWIDAEEQTGTDGSVITNVTDQAGVLSGITIEGSVLLNIDGNGKKEFSFTGSGNAINLGNPALLDFMPGTDEFTIMGMSGTGIPTAGFFVCKGVIYNNMQYGININNNSYYWTSIGSSWDYFTTSNGLVQENQHFVLVVSPTESKLYLNGQLIQTRGSGSVGTDLVNVDVLIGARRDVESTNTGLGFEFETNIKNIGIFSKALSATEIQNIYNELTNPVSDTQAPTPPNLLSSAQTDTTVSLSWNGASDNVAVTGYKLFKNNELEATLENVGSYQVSGLVSQNYYEFTVSALDAAGNESPASNMVAVTTDSSSGGGESTATIWSESGGTANYTGNVAIGTTSVPTGYRLAVEGHIRTREIRVDQDAWPDYVFLEGYELPSLGEIKKYIEEKGHLPNIPSANEVEANGMELGRMDRLLLEKIEELTLFAIRMEEQYKQQMMINEELRSEIKILKKQTDEKL